MPKQIDLIINGKGGVGKSFFAVNFIQYLKDQRVQHRCVDTDHENSTLKRFHAEAEFINIEKPQEVDQIFTHLAQTELLVIDCRAASTDLFIEYFREVDLFDLLLQMDATLTVVSPINHEADSVEQIHLLTEAFGNRCRYLIVKNESHSEQFALYEKSRTKQRLNGELQGAEIRVSRMPDWLVTSLNSFNVTTTAALNHPGFSLVDRQRLKRWQRDFNHQLTLTSQLLIPVDPKNQSEP